MVALDLKKAPIEKVLGPKNLQLSPLGRRLARAKREKFGAVTRFKKDPQCYLFSTSHEAYTNLGGLLDEHALKKVTGHLPFPEDLKEAITFANGSDMTPVEWNDSHVLVFAKLFGARTGEFPDAETLLANRLKSAKMIVETERIVHSSQFRLNGF